MWPAIAKRPDERPQVPARLRVEAGGRLVEEQDARIVHQRRRDAEALLLTAGQRPHLALRLLGQLHLGEQAHRVGTARPYRRPNRSSSSIRVSSSKKADAWSWIPIRRLTSRGSRADVDAVDRGAVPRRSAACPRSSRAWSSCRRRSARGCRRPRPRPTSKLTPSTAVSVAVALAQVAGDDDRLRAAGRGRIRPGRARGCHGGHPTGYPDARSAAGASG